MEYDYGNPQDLDLTLESKKISNLFLLVKLMEQLDMSAAAQGLIAGINASLKVKGEMNLYCLEVNLILE